MRYTQLAVLTWAVLLVGCSPDSSHSLSAVEKPKYEAVVVIRTAKKGQGGMLCESEMGATGAAGCGPDSSLTDLSWEFTEHRSGSDYYKFSWTMSSAGDTMASENVKVGFDGNDETVVINAEHYIVIRKGPLNPKAEQAE